MTHREAKRFINRHRALHSINIHREKEKVEREREVEQGKVREIGRDHE